MHEGKQFSMHHACHMTTNGGVFRHHWLFCPSDERRTLWLAGQPVRDFLTLPMTMSSYLHQFKTVTQFSVIYFYTDKSQPKKTYHTKMAF